MITTPNLQSLLMKWRCSYLYHKKDKKKKKKDEICAFPTLPKRVSSSLIRGDLASYGFMIKEEGFMIKEEEFKRLIKDNKDF